MNIKFSKKLFAILLSGSISLSTLNNVKITKANAEELSNNKAFINQLNNFNYISYEEYIKAKTNVNIRKEASVNSEKLGLLYKDKTLKFLGYDNSFAKVIYNGTVAYVHKDYVDIVYNLDINKDIQKYGYLKRESTITSLDNESKYTFPKYELCEIYDSNDNYYLVKCENKIGLIKKRDVERLSGKFVVIDISSQNLKLYNDKNIEINTSVVTGNNENPSDIGLFSIYSKRQNTYLKGEDYSRFVNYWMAYNGGEGIHDAYWRNSFGGNIYKKRGSHGCINMPLTDAEELYENVKIGTKVLVKK